MAPSNMDDVIDSREIIERIEELETDLADGAYSDAEDRAADEAELKALKALAEEASGCSDWKYGETLIRGSYFEEYTEELINDCYEFPKEFNSGEWPWRHMSIDYEAAAEELKMDYTSVDFDGVEYWIRS